MAAIGLAFPCPAMSGADPCTGSNIETPPGHMLPDAATPRPPMISAPRSVRMSPNMFGQATTPKRSGARTSAMAMASTYMYSTSMP